MIMAAEEEEEEEEQQQQEWLPWAKGDMERLVEAGEAPHRSCACRVPRSATDTIDLDLLLAGGIHAAALHAAIDRGAAATNTGAAQTDRGAASTTPLGMAARECSFDATRTASQCTNKRLQQKILWASLWAVLATGTSDTQTASAHNASIYSKSASVYSNKDYTGCAPRRPRSTRSCGGEPGGGLQAARAEGPASS